MDVNQVQVKAAMSRVRGYNKWKNSDSLIGELIKSADKFKTKKGTWCRDTKKWLKRFKLDTAVSNSNGREEVLKKYNEKNKE